MSNMKKCDDKDILIYKVKLKKWQTILFTGRVLLLF